MAAERPYTPLILVGKELKLGQFRQRPTAAWCHRPPAAVRSLGPRHRAEAGRATSGMVYLGCVLPSGSQYYYNHSSSHYRCYYRQVSDSDSWLHCLRLHLRLLWPRACLSLLPAPGPRLVTRH